MKTNRRAWLKQGMAAAMYASLSRLGASDIGANTGDDEIREYLKSVLYSQEEVAAWLAGTVNPFLGVKYDPVLGWIHHDGVGRDGMDGSSCIYTFDQCGERRMLMYGDRPCRINTYGNSMTLCAQVSDGETWQEYLAAHLGEPVHNFGIGGFSSYQAYLRMLQQEARTPAKYIIFNIFSNDHYRNLRAWSALETLRPASGKLGVRLPPDPYVRVNLATGEYIEVPNPCPTPETLRQLADLDWVCHKFKDDFMLKVIVARKNIAKGTPEKNYSAFGEQLRIDSTTTFDQAINGVHTRAALFSTMRIVEKIEAFASAGAKKVLYVLSYGSFSKQTTQPDLERFLRGEQRFDQEFVDFLRKKNLPYIDGLEAHRMEFSQFKLSIEDYLRRYYIGHYNARGNYFQAFAIKDKLVEILEPKPITYASAEPM